MTPDTPDRIGPYRIDRILGRGAMSTVFQAENHATGQMAAVKLLRTEILADSERHATIERFRREADLCRRLDHPNVVRVFDVGEAGGNPYLAMEMLGQQSLADLLRGPRLAPARAVRLVLDLLGALSYVHAHDIVHRDIKPANVVVDEGDRLTLVDFGIAHVGGSDITRIGDMLGSPAYMSPEQLAGNVIDARADLFAVGIVLYALVTRQRPFSGTVANVMQAILHESPVAPSQIDAALPAALDRIVARALAKAPDARYQSAAEFATALRDLLPDLSDAIETQVAPSPPGREGDTDAGLAPARVPAALQQAHAQVTAGRLEERLVSGLERAEAGWEAWDADARRGLAELVEQWPDDLRALSSAIVGTAPFPNMQQRGRGDWMLLVRLAAASLRLLHRMGHTALARSHHRQLSDELSEPFIVHVDTVGMMLARDENPDLMRLSMGLLRLDVLEMALEALSATAELRLARKTRTLVAIQAMRKVNETVAACTRTGDMMARFDMALMMGEVEALISIAGRLTEDSGVAAGRQLTATAQGVITDFIAGAAELSAMTVAELGAMDATGGGRAYGAKLRQLQTLYLFATRLPGEQHRALMVRFAAGMHDQIEGLARSLMSTKGSEDALSAIYDMAAELGWQGLAAEILMHLKAG